MFNNKIVATNYLVEGKLIPLYNGPKAREGFSKEILDCGIMIFMDYLLTHRKILFFTVTLSFPVNYPNYNASNDRIIPFTKMLSQALARKGYDPAYMWVREKDTSKHHHYHLALWLNGSIIQHPQKAIDEIVEKWQQGIGQVDGCVHFQSAYSNVFKLERKQENNLNTLFAALKSLSYLAKIYSKEADLKSYRHYGYSQAKRNEGYQLYEKWKVPAVPGKQPTTINNTINNNYNNTTNNTINNNYNINSSNNYNYNNNYNNNRNNYEDERWRK